MVMMYDDQTMNTAEPLPLLPAVTLELLYCCWYSSLALILLLLKIDRWMKKYHHPHPHHNHNHNNNHHHNPTSISSQQSSLSSS